MSLSIYSIPDWEASTNYKVNDIVKNGSFFYYALINHTSTASFASDLSSLYWGGVTPDDNGISKPHFIWVPSYGSNVNNQPKVKTMQFGDGFQQRVRDGISNILIKIDLSFESRSYEEATAILHFLFAREGVESFMFTPPQPYNRKKRFVCNSWEDVRTFYNSLTIRAQFEEVVT